ncbi:MAG: hypothetical protein AAF970_17770 [Bacteroidota bacterium]
MRSPRSLRADAPFRAPLTGWSLLLAIALCVPEAQAQRPVQVYDPFYRQESARRAFFDRLALTGEVTYGSASEAPAAGLSSASLPLGLAVRLDYQLTRHIDLSTIIDATAGRLGRTLSLSWVVLKYYDCSESQDCLAVRVAADPTTDGRVGFPQLDLALISTSYLTPYLSNDFALGVRRVRMGYEQWRPRDSMDLDASPVQPSQFDILYTRALGAELHVMMNTNVVLGPAGSTIYASILAHAGQYELIESNIREQEARQAASPLEATVTGEETATTNYRGGVVWGRAGFSISRPGYLLTPFIGLPLHQWIPGEDGWQTARSRFGLRLMLR